MKLASLLPELQANFASCPLLEAEITAITQDSRQMQPGALFFYTGANPNYLQQAVEKGAAAVVCQSGCGLPNQLVVPNVRRAYSLACGNFYGNPANRLHLIGVTGTNGKTSITYLLHHILMANGVKTGLIGTVCSKIGNMELAAHYTTPDAAQLHQLLAQMEKAGCTHVVMEASSHALAQHRLAGCTFDCGVLSNLTQDHLDYHKTMENYYQAKKQLFLQSKHAVLNWDDSIGKRLAGECPCPVTTYSIADTHADYTAMQIEPGPGANRFFAVGKSEISRVNLPMPGRFSVSNAMAALTAAQQLGLPLEAAAQSLNCCPGVPGRMEVLPSKADFTVMRDYAHTGDGLEKVLTMVRQYAGGRVITLFGCAGQRDRAKRREMGAIAARYSDMVILTSDNPRQEPEEQIAQDTLPGLLEYKTPFRVILDREEAITFAFNQCKKGDILLLAGKGHEDYQALKDKTIYFDEKALVARLSNPIEK